MCRALECVRRPGLVHPAAISAIEASGNPLPRQIQTTVARRLLEDKGVEEPARKKKKEDERVEKEARKERKDKAKKRTEQGAMNWPFEDLEDDPPPPAPTAKAARGAPKLVLLDKLILSCHSKKDPETRRVRCVGNGCHVSWAQPRSSGRVFAHSADCRYLPPNLKEQALLTNAGQPLSLLPLGWGGPPTKARTPWHPLAPQQIPLRASFSRLEACLHTHRFLRYEGVFLRENASNPVIALTSFAPLGGSWHTSASQISQAF
ncbi:hypothetical protein B0H10DRAFT_1968907 [Mycena sp. CBHHK59/15]|nr:hypothetical protein B0H10DRAFT_1968907 [Mycena sp. CBHHK59/15]